MPIDPMISSPLQTPGQSEFILWIPWFIDRLVKSSTN